MPMSPSLRAPCARLAFAALGLCLVLACAEENGPQTAAPVAVKTPAPPPPPAAQLASANAMPDRQEVVRLQWGVGAEVLGRSRPAEANPEAPMAVAGDKAGQLWILDQVQDRVVQLSKGALGRSLALPVQGAQDVALDGEQLLILDRLVNKVVVAMSVKDGSERWRMPVVQGELTHGGGVTGLFAHDDGLWLEWAHENSVRIGALDGSHDTGLKRLPTLAGRPSRDGKLALAAVRAGAQQVVLTGRSIAAGAGRDLQPTWTAAAQFDQPVLAIRALESDPWGRVWLAVNTFVEQEDGTVTDERLEVLRFGVDGQLHGRQPATREAGPEEQLRTFSAGLDGTFWHLARTEAGAVIERWAP